MANINLDVFILLLKFAKNNIKESIEDYEKTGESVHSINKTQSDIDKNQKLHFSIDYHMFTFSQLMYCILERVKKEHPFDVKKIDRFFNKSQNSVAKSIFIGNNIKHGHLRFSHCQPITVQVDSTLKPIKVIKHKVDRSLTVVNHKKLEISLESKKLKGVQIRKIFDESYDELLNFIKFNNY